MLPPDTDFHFVVLHVVSRNLDKNVESFALKTLLPILASPGLSDKPFSKHNERNGLKMTCSKKYVIINGSKEVSSSRTSQKGGLSTLEGSESVAES